MWQEWQQAHCVTYCDPTHVLVYVLGKGLDSGSCSAFQLRAREVRLSITAVSVNPGKTHTVTAARKTPRKTATARRGAKHKGAKGQSVKVTLPPAKPIPSTDLLSEPPGFLIVGIGASAGGLEAMEELRVPEGERPGAGRVRLKLSEALNLSLDLSLL
jgi:hypothetical protein